MKRMHTPFLAVALLFLACACSSTKVVVATPYIGRESSGERTMRLLLERVKLIEDEAGKVAGFKLILSAKNATDRPWDVRAGQFHCTRDEAGEDVFRAESPADGTDRVALIPAHTTARFTMRFEPPATEDEVLGRYDLSYRDTWIDTHGELQEVVLERRLTVDRYTQWLQGARLLGLISAGLLLAGL